MWGCHVQFMGFMDQVLADLPISAQVWLALSIAGPGCNH